MSGEARRIREAGDGATTPPTVLTVGQIDDGQYLRRAGDTIIGDTPSGGGGGGGAPDDAHYVVTQSDGTLTNEHVLSAPDDGIDVTVGAGTVTVTPADDLAAIEALTGTGIATRTGSSVWMLADAGDVVAAGRVDPIFGDGSDGDVTLGTTTTLSRNVQYGALNLAGQVLNTAGFVVRCRELRDSVGGGQIRHNGGTATANVSGAGAPNGFVGGGTTGGVAGGSGGGNGSAATGRSDSWPALRGAANAGDGGAGGASGGAGNGGSGGNAAAGLASKGFGGYYWLDQGRYPDAGQLFGGSGGGGGGSQAGAGAAGGAGGGGGGVCKVLAYLLGTGASGITISADGGGGGNATLGASAGCGGGGGGGGGGASLVYQVEVGGVPTVTASGGAGGTGAGAGAAGSAGQDGVTEIVQLGT